jgi:hypothetical protein
VTTAAKKKAPHPNKVPFEGVLCRLDEPSDIAPTGARNRRVILTKQAAEEGLESLLGMGLDFTKEWDGHDARRKCGVITNAHIEGEEIHVSGHLYSRDFPEIRRYLETGVEMGMSYEMADAHVENMRADVWKLTAVTFTGAAILLRSKAAYRKTRFSISASAAVERFTGRLSFIDQRVKTGRAVRT